MQNYDANSTNGQKYERTYKQKDENYIPLDINAGAITRVQTIYSSSGTRTPGTFMSHLH